MKPVFLRVFAVFLIAFFCYASSAQVPCNISGACGSISAAGGVGGQTIFCEGQTVPFYNQSDPASVDSSFIDWGDGSPRQAFSGTPDVTHTYDFPNDTCVEQIGIIITLTVIRHCANGVSRHCSFFPLAIKFPPVPKFLIDGDFCVGEPIVMDNRTCENADSTAYEWDFDNGTPPTSTEFNPTVTYNMTGFYTITLAATNDCGTVDTQRIIRESELFAVGRQKLTDEFSARTQVLELEEARLRELESRRDRDIATMSTPQAAELKREIETLERSIQRRRNDMKQALNRRINELSETIDRRIQEEIGAYAREQGFELVLTDGVGFAHPRLDITDAILQRVNAHAGELRGP